MRATRRPVALRSMREVRGGAWITRAEAWRIAREKGYLIRRRGSVLRERSAMTPEVIFRRAWATQVHSADAVVVARVRRDDDS